MRTTAVNGVLPLANTGDQLRKVVPDGREDLSQAFAAYGDTFPPLYASSLRAGEKSGELESVIRRFIRYTRLLLDARRKVFSALVYPAVLVALSKPSFGSASSTRGIKFTSVDLPLPVRPTKAIVCPASMVRLILSSTHSGLPLGSRNS